MRRSCRHAGSTSSCAGSCTNRACRTSRSSIPARSTRSASAFVAGAVKSLGIDCVPGEWDESDTELIERKFRIHGLGEPPAFQKFVCGKKLYNYDNLEPSERKLVL